MDTMRDDAERIYGLHMEVYSTPLGELPEEQEASIWAQVEDLRGAIRGRHGKEALAEVDALVNARLCNDPEAV